MWKVIAAMNFHRTKWCVTIRGLERRKWEKWERPHSIVKSKRFWTISVRRLWTNSIGIMSPRWSIGRKPGQLHRLIFDKVVVAVWYITNLLQAFNDPTNIVACIQRPYSFNCYGRTAMVQTCLNKISRYAIPNLNLMNQWNKCNKCTDCIRLRKWSQLKMVFDHFDPAKFSPSTFENDSYAHAVHHASCIGIRFVRVCYQIMVRKYIDRRVATNFAWQLASGTACIMQIDFGSLTKVYRISVAPN